MSMTQCINRTCFDSLTGLNLPQNLQLVAALVTELGFRHGVARNETVFEELDKTYRRTMFGRLKESLVDRYQCKLKMDSNDLVELIKYYRDLTDYDMSSYSLFAEDSKTVIVSIKLSELLPDCQDNFLAGVA